MWMDLLSSLSLIDVSGFIIIGIILLILLASIGVNLSVRRQYARIEGDLKDGIRTGMPFRTRFLKKLMEDAREMMPDYAGETGFQALIEHRVKQELGGALLAERFLKSAAGLLIVLGLVGTFYGLTLSIGKLVALITGDVSGIAEMTSSLTKGLAGALSGMSVAFSTSLVGIVSAIVVLLTGVFFSPQDRRDGLTLRLEVYLDGLNREQCAKGGRPDGRRGAQAADDIAKSVAALQDTVAAFDAALKSFSSNTRDFQEFNLHLKDNIQRMSLGFADLGDTLKQQVGLLARNRPAGQR